MKLSDLIPKIEQIGNTMIQKRIDNTFSPEETVSINQKLDNALDEFYSINNSALIDFDKINSILNREELILITDLNGWIIYINNKCSSSIGYPPNELVGKHTRIFNAGIHSKKFYANLWNSLKSGEVWTGEISAKRKDGSIAWYFMLISPVLDDHYQPYQFLTLRIDITEQKKKEKQAIVKDKQFNSLMEILQDNVVGFIDQNGKITFLSPSIENVTGYKASDRLGFSVFDYMCAEDIPSFKKSLLELRQFPGRSKSLEIKLRDNNGSIITCEFSAKSYLHDPLINGIIFSYQDITAQKKFLQEIKNIIYIDIITGLPNYASFEKKFNEEVINTDERNPNLAIVQLGLDDFKYVNSTFGHDIGDQLLKDFSKRMQTVLPDNVFMYRMSGDIFILLIKNIGNIDEVSETLKLLLSNLNEEPFFINETKMFVTVSVGISVFPFSGIEKEELLKNAEVAMYSAKNSGKNQYQVFSPTMDVYSYKQFILRNDLKAAILNNEFCVYYQPRINLNINKMVSAEALIRWNHPNWGVVRPDEFVKISEESGLIVQIGEWVIRKVCEDLKKWEKENLIAKKISINISPLQLIQPNFVETVSLILKEFNVNPKWIEFEITENVIIKEEEKSLNKLTKLKEMGITIALDDFGTGYSSLNYLKKLPCDTIKIDKSLIREIHKEKVNLEITGSTISLCHKLKKAVVAEGVETDQELTVLRNLQCDEIQGYLYSKPVNEQEFKKLLIEGIFVKEERKVSSPINDQRKYFRIPLEYPLVADMTIKEIRKRKINLGCTEVFIKNIGPGGLCFYSPLILPVNKEIILQFTTEISSEEIELKGFVVWFKETENNYNQYGVKFTLTNLAHEKFIKILNTLQIKLKHHSVSPDCRFYSNKLK